MAQPHSTQGSQLEGADVVAGTLCAWLGLGTHAHSSPHSGVTGTWSILSGNTDPCHPRYGWQPRHFCLHLIFLPTASPLWAERGKFQTNDKLWGPPQHLPREALVGCQGPNLFKPTPQKKQTKNNTPQWTKIIMQAFIPVVCAGKIQFSLWVLRRDGIMPLRIFFTDVSRFNIDTINCSCTIQ